MIWIIFLGTIFWSGPEATQQYTVDLLREGAPGGALVVGFTETGTASIVDDKTAEVFRTGNRAIMDAIGEVAIYCIS